MENKNVAINFQYMLSFSKIRKNVDVLFKKMMAERGYPIDSAIGWNLIYLNQNKGITLAQLADIASIPASKATRNVRLLVNEGFVEKFDDPHDSRKYNLYLTKVGMQVETLSEQVFLEIDKIYFNNLNDHQKQNLFVYFSQIAYNLDQEVEKYQER